MSIEVLILGKLHQRAEQRTSKAGRPFVTAKARAAAGEGEAVFVNVVAFSDTACASLLALEAGDSLALAGTLKAGAWIDREGAARPSLDMVAAQVLTVYGLKKKREAAQDGVRQKAPPINPPGDEFGQGDAWLDEGANV